MRKLTKRSRKVFPRAIRRLGLLASTIIARGSNQTRPNRERSRFGKSHVPNCLRTNNNHSSSCRTRTDEINLGAVPVEAIRVTPRLFTIKEGCFERTWPEVVASFRTNGITASHCGYSYRLSLHTNERIDLSIAGTDVRGWHDLRRTFATRLRANGVHEYDISDLLGHSRPGVTTVYARATRVVLEQAVENLREPWGQ